MIELKPPSTTTSTQGATVTVRAELDADERRYLLDIRQGLIMQLRAVETRLGMPLSVPPKRPKEQPLDTSR